MKSTLIALWEGIKWCGSVVLVFMAVLAATYFFIGPFWLAAEYNNGYFLLLYIIHVALIGWHIKAEDNG